MNPIAIIGILFSLTTLVVIIVYGLSNILTFKNVLRWVVIYSAISFLTDGLLQLSSNKSGYILLFSFTLLEYALFAWMFYLMLSNPVNKRIVIVGSFAFLVMVSITLRNFGDLEFDNVNSGTEAILIIIYSILFFSEKLNIENLEPIFDSPSAFIVIGCLIYLAGNLFLFITSEKQNTNLWILNSALNLVRNICFIIAIRKCTKPAKPRPSLRSF
jgi:hypothetical protein